MAAEPSPSKVNKCLRQAMGTTHFLFKNHSQVIPQGYTFLSPDIFVSKKAKEVVDDLLEKSERRNPDFHDIYVYNGEF